MHDLYQSTKAPTKRLVTKAGAGLPPGKSSEDWRIVSRQGANIPKTAIDDVEKNGFAQYEWKISIDIAEPDSPAAQEARRLSK